VDRQRSDGRRSILAQRLVSWKEWVRRSSKTWRQTPHGPTTLMLAWCHCIGRRTPSADVLVEDTLLGSPSTIELRLVRSRVETPVACSVQPWTFRGRCSVALIAPNGTRLLACCRWPDHRHLAIVAGEPIIKAKLSQEANRLSRILEEDNCPADSAMCVNAHGPAAPTALTGISRKSLARVKVGAVRSALDVGLWRNFGGG